MFQITPPFVPQVMSETDTRNFDIEFTGESVELTPPEDSDQPSELTSISEADEADFSQFSYQVANKAVGICLTDYSIAPMSNLKMYKLIKK